METGKLEHAKQTADALVAAFNAMDIPTILSFRSPCCLRTIVPRSLNILPASNNAFEKHRYQVRSVFANYKLDVHDVVEDVAARRIVMWLAARADTVDGPYESEYMWTMEFDESGEKIVAMRPMREFVDAVMKKEFGPKFRKALEQAKDRDEKGAGNS
ncbi:MAG: hypothetical protein Q9187_007052 [Circinaria calcarea]